MLTIQTAHGVTVSYEKYGSGPPLVLVHGAFSDHRTNWEFVLPFFTRTYTVYAIARRGRGATDCTIGHSIEEESLDVLALIRAIGQPVYLLGHSYGAHVALAAALRAPTSIRKLVLYEAPWPSLLGDSFPEALTTFAEAGDWDRFSYWFFSNVLFVPASELDALRATDLWEPIKADAKASLGDLTALGRYAFDPAGCAKLCMPVLLQMGTESPCHLYVTDRLSEIIPDAQISPLDGQAHEGMTTAPRQYADAVCRFLPA